MNARNELDKEIKERRGEIQKQEAELFKRKKIQKDVQIILRKKKKTQKEKSKI